MKSHLKFILLCLLVFAFYFSTHEVYAKESKHYIVLMENEDSLESILSEYQHLLSDTNRLHTLPAFSSFLSEETLNILKENPHVVSIEEEHVAKKNGEVVKPPKGFVSTNSIERVDWGMKAINVHTSWKDKIFGKKVKVAVIDSGIDLNHRDLNVVGGKSFVDYTTSYHDDNGHGTHVAGIISAQHNGFGIKGVAPNVELYALKVLNEHGTGSSSSIIDAINWCIDNDIDIINMSLSLNGESTLLNWTVDAAISNNILVVASAGNEGRDNSVLSPASHPDTIAVSSIDPVKRISEFSSRGPEVNVTAPGHAIYSTYRFNSYEYMSGTSMAAPYVSGTLALIKEKYPNLSIKQYKELLYQNTVDLGVTGFDVLYGHGLIQSPPYQTSHLTPEAPNGLKANPLDKAVMLTWFRHNNKNVIGFNVYVNNRKVNKNLIQLTYFKVTDLINYQNYKFELTAVHQNGFESKKSVIYAMPIPNEPIHPPIEVRFKDVPANFWAKNQIDFVFSKGWMKGTSPETFNPNGLLTRAQASVILVRAMKLEPKYILDYPTFKDVGKNHWAYNEIEIAAQHGLFSGYANGNFGPNDNIKREHLAAVLTRAFYKDYPLENLHSSFKDVSKNRWTYEAISIMQKENIFGGYQDGTFKPENPTTRAHMATVMYRLQDKLK